MLYFRMLMADADGGALGGGTADTPEPDTSTEAPTTPDESDSDNGEGTTPEEVAQVLKSAGMDVQVPAAEDETQTDDEDTTDTEEEPAPATTDTPSEVADATPETPTATETGDTGNAPDFSFEVVDAEGVTHKVAPGDKMEEVLADFALKNNGQALDILDQLNQARDAQKAYEADQAAKAEADQAAQTVQSIQDGWQQEYKTLGIPADRQDAIMEHMKSENDKRQADGRPLIRTIEHANLSLQAQEAKDSEASAAKEAKDTARKNGALVGGSSAPASSAPPAYVAGTARNANEAIRNLNLI